MIDMDQKFKMFVKDNVEYYNRAWEREYKWNWAAFFLSYFWLGYRRMYSLIFALLGINLLIIFTLCVIDFELYNSLYDLIAIGFWIFLGLAGNKLYKRKAEKTIIHVSRLRLSEEDELTELEKRGGASGFGVLGAIGILIIFAFTVGMMITAIEFWRYY